MFAKSFVPVEVRSIRLTYIRLSPFSVLSSAIDAAVAAATRAMDKSDVPLVINPAGSDISITLDMLLLPWLYVGLHGSTVNIQTAIQLACSLVSTFVSFAYLLWTDRHGIEGN